MASVNKVILVGNLGRDPETRYATSGSAICNITVATSRQWKDKASGEKKEETEWHRVVFYDRLAEIAGEYLKKGRPVYVEGRLKTRKWQDKEGQDRYTTEIVAEEMQLLGSREGRWRGRSRRRRRIRFGRRRCRRRQRWRKERQRAEWQRRKAEDRRLRRRHPVLRSSRKLQSIFRSGSAAAVHGAAVTRRRVLRASSSWRRHSRAR